MFTVLVQTRPGVIVLAITLPGTAGRSSANGLPDERFDIAPRENLALGNSNTFSHWPHFKTADSVHAE